MRGPEFEPLGRVGIVITDPANPDFEKHTITEPFGAFYINKLIPGTYVVHAFKDGYEPRHIPVYIHRGRNFVAFRMFPEDEGPPDE